MPASLPKWATRVSSCVRRLLGISERRTAKAPPEVAVPAEIKELGWRQGSFLPSSTIKRLIKEGVLPADIEHSCRLMVISHDCDLLHPDLHSEPFVELLGMSEVNKIDGNFARTKSPRRYHLEIQLTGKRTKLEISIHNLMRIPKAYLTIEAPAETTDPKTTRQLAYWVTAATTAWAYQTRSTSASPQRTRNSQRSSKVTKTLSSASTCSSTTPQIQPERPYKISIRAVMKKGPLCIRRPKRRHNWY